MPNKPEPSDPAAWEEKKIAQDKWRLENHDPWEEKKQAQEEWAALKHEIDAIDEQNAKAVPDDEYTKKKKYVEKYDSQKDKNRLYITRLRSYLRLCAGHRDELLSEGSEQARLEAVEYDESCKKYEKDIEKWEKRDRKVEEIRAFLELVDRARNS